MMNWMRRSSRCVCVRERERETCGKLGSKAASSLDDDELYYDLAVSIMVTAPLCVPVLEPYEL